MPRKQPSLTEKLASALLELQRLRGDPIDREAAKAMTADAICAMFDIDHDPIPVANGGTNHPTNLTPRLRAEHREKTKVDVGKIAKGKRLEKDFSAHRAKLLAKVRSDVESIIEGKPKRKAKISNRGFPDKHTRQAMKERYGKRP